MRIGRLIAVSILSITALTAVLGAGVLLPQYRTFTDKTEAIKAVDAFATVLIVGQQVAGHRAPYVGPLFQDGVATPPQLEAIAKIAQTSDAAFAKARTAVSALSDSAALVEGLDQAAAKLADLRTATNHMLTAPMSGRDPAIVKGLLPAVSQVIGLIEPVLNRLQNQVATADASLTALLNIARTAQDIRITAGARGATVVFAIGTRRVLTAAELASVDRNTGRLELDRERIASDVDQIGNPDRLAKAMKDAIASYFGPSANAERMDKELQAARSDAKYTVNADEWADIVVPAAMSFLVARDAALTEAAERARAARDGALMTLALAAAMALLGLLAGVMFVMRRRVIQPLATFTDVISDLAAGRHDVSVPDVNRADEIGTMAGALQVFKDVLIAKTVADETAAAESNAKIERAQRVDRVTRDFESVIGEIVEIVSQASTRLEASADSLASTAEYSQTTTAAVAAASEEASSNVHSVAAAAEEMASSVNEISRQVQDSAQIASEAVDQAQRTNSRVGELAKAAARIGDVVELINTIAGQTNLLALNATIEAARAGEAGRGFAVVASEVKALAEQTAKATGEISQQINGIQAATQESVGAIREIGQTISRMSEIASAIAAAVEQQGAATQEISRNVQRAAQGTQQVSANIIDVERSATQTGSSSSQVLSAAKSLSTESSRLQVTVDKFLSSVRAA
jgi:methyl-accepting chemotaxis protein